MKIANTSYPRCEDVTGQKFGKLTAIKPVGKHSGKRTIIWQWRCECGEITEGAINPVKSGHKISCGCMGGGLKFDSPLTQLYAVYRANANKRKIQFSLDKYEFRLLTSGNCYYCGAPPSQIRTQRTGKIKYIYNGIDRVDNKIGYVVYNCVPCCRVCNYFKLDSIVDDFVEKHLNWVEQAHAFLHNPIFTEIKR